MQDYEAVIGYIGKNVSVSRFQGIEGGALLDCTEVRMIRKNGKPVTLRLSKAEVQELINLLACSVSENIYSLSLRSRSSYS